MDDIENHIRADIGGLMIVPDALSAAVDTKIDRALMNLPADAENDRPYFREMLLRYFAEHGTLPDITIWPRESAD